jgi:hypothetical protein
MLGIAVATGGCARLRPSTDTVPNASPLIAGSQTMARLTSLEHVPLDVQQIKERVDAFIATFDCSTA